MARNLPAAQVHGRILAHLLEEQSKTDPVDLRQLTNILYDDVSLSAMFLIRPTFDTREWVLQMIRPVLLGGARELPPAQELSIGTLDASISNKTLRDLFVCRREISAVWMYLTANGIMHSLLLGVWFAVRSILQSASLVHYYLDTIDATRSPPTDPNKLRAQSYLALAALYFSRITRFSPTINGVRLYDAGPVISTQLRLLLMQGEEECSRFQNARLWALYVGAQAEQMPLRNRPEPTTAWFNTNFAVQARRMGLLSWQAVRVILERFIFSDLLQPHPSQ
jgi:hypothetical protein